MDITTLSNDQLKSLAYDQIIARDTAQNNIQVIQQELQRRASLPPELPEAPSPEPTADEPKKRSPKKAA